MFLRGLLVLSLAGLCACGARQDVPAAPPVAVESDPELNVGQVGALLPARAKPRGEWAEAVWSALWANSIIPTRATACTVIAVVAQESGFQADPVVPNLARLVNARLEAYQEKLPIIGKPLFARLLSGHAPADPRTFSLRLENVRTEGDLDRIFRDMLAFYEAQYPTTFAAAKLAGHLFDVEDLRTLNPITTAGSMQVSVRYAEQWAREQKGADPAKVRDELYTIKGGVYYGTARLMGFAAHYDTPLYRFADYNAGVYSSRNAALQAQLGTVVGVKLAWDGDVLAYEPNGSPKQVETETLRALATFAAQHAQHLTPKRLRADAELEKTLAFEQTETYAAVRRVFAAKMGRKPKYAIVPDVALHSPKFSQNRSTAWFADSVQRRYKACLEGPSRS